MTESPRITWDRALWGEGVPATRAGGRRGGLFSEIFVLTFRVATSADTSRTKSSEKRGGAARGRARRGHSLPPNGGLFPNLLPALPPQDFHELGSGPSHLFIGIIEMRR